MTDSQKAQRVRDAAKTVRIEMLSQGETIFAETLQRLAPMDDSTLAKLHDLIVSYDTPADALASLRAA